MFMSTTFDGRIDTDNSIFTVLLEQNLWFCLFCRVSCMVQLHKLGSGNSWLANGWGLKCFIVHLGNMLFQLLVPLSLTALLMLESVSCTGHVAYLSSMHACTNLLADVGILCYGLVNRKVPIYHLFRIFHKNSVDQFVCYEPICFGFDTCLPGLCSQIKIISFHLCSHNGDAVVCLF